MRILKTLNLLILLPFIFLISCGAKSNTYRRKIISVHDGDTFTDEASTKYRLYGVDTPETSSQYNDFKSTEGIEKIYAIEATNFTKHLILNKIIQVIHITIDPYGRDVSRIMIGNKDLSMELIKAGLARVAYIDVIKDSIYETKDYDYFKKLLRCQYNARLEKKGFWLRENYFSTIFPKA